MTYTQRVDNSLLTALALCSCGWRDLADDWLDARERIHHHVLSCHPELQDVTRRARNRLRQRDAG